MIDGIFEKIRQTMDITDVVERFGVKLDRYGKAICPFHNEKTPSFSIQKNENKFHCFGCGAGGDAVDFVSKIKGTEPLEAAKIIAEMYGFSEPVGNGGKKVNTMTKENKKKPCDASAAPDVQENAEPFQKRDTAIIKKYIEKCTTHVSETDYFKIRGLTDDTVKKYGLGYDPDDKRIVMPYSSKYEYYAARSTIIQHGEPFFIIKPKTEIAGDEPLFFKEMLYGKAPAVFIVESQICALSVVQCGYPAAALCGASCGSKLINAVKAKAPQSILILALDNDAQGQKSQQELANQLFELNVKFVVNNIAGECKDPNELLVLDPKALTANLKEAIQTAKKEFSKLKKLFSAKELQKREMRPIKWIVRDLLPEGLALLAAPSKYGKSWMMMQLCVAVASGKPFLEHKTEKCDCVYCSIEDSERRFKGRLNKVTNNQPAPDGFYGIVTMLSMVNGIFEQLEELMETYPNIGLIIIDTFQKVRGGQGKNESVYGADYREMGQMKAFADKHGICLLLVHHLRKQDDEGDVFNRINGSMALMGASDTSWVMSRKKRGDINTTLTVTGRDIDDGELIICFDKPTVTWNLVGNAEDEAARLARAEYEGNSVIKTVKALVEKHPAGWRGNCSEIKVQIYEQTGMLFQGSADMVGRTISKYLDRLLADGIIHTEERGKRHLFTKKQIKLFDYDKKVSDSDNDT